MMRLTMDAPSRCPAWWGGAALRGIVLLLAASTGACDRIIGVETSPYLILSDNAEVPGNARILLGGALNEFECAFGRYTVMGGLFGNELMWSNYSPWGRDADLRAVDPENSEYAFMPCGSSNSVYKPLSSARWMADNVLRLFKEWTDEEMLPADRTDMIAHAAAYAGYSLVLLGEAMCSAALDVGPELQPNEIFAEAEARFTEAIQAAGTAGTDSILNLARVGRARTLLNLGRAAEAATDAESVPLDFVIYATYDSEVSRRYNNVHNRTERNQDITIDEPFRDVRFQGILDPRFKVVYQGLASDQKLPLYYTEKYPDRDADVELATWEEAQLIIAEARGGQEAVAIINTLHARVGLPPFTSSDPAEIQQQIIYERQAELFLETHHLGDMRRYGLEFFPVAGTVYPGVGAAIYGSQTCYPIPTAETANNPNIGD